MILLVAREHEEYLLKFWLENILSNSKNSMISYRTRTRVKKHIIHFLLPRSINRFSPRLIRLDDVFLFVVSRPGVSAISDGTESLRRRQSWPTLRSPLSSATLTPPEVLLSCLDLFFVLGASGSGSDTRGASPRWSRISDLRLVTRPDPEWGGNRQFWHMMCQQK